jgi:hypothetical protein
MDDDVLLHRPIQGSGLTKVPYHHFKEESEQIDELSKSTLGGFIKKSKETFKDVPDAKKGNRLRNVLIAAGKKDLKKEEVSSRVYKPEVERAFPASGVKTIVPKHKYSTMPKDKEKAKGMPAGSMYKEEIQNIEEGPKDPPFEPSKSPFKKLNNPNRSFLDSVKALAQKGKKDAEKKSIKETTGDKSFDSAMKNIVKGTSKQRTADRIAQKKQNQERARNAFGSMFGGGNPSDKLKIKEDFDQIDEVSTSTLVSYRKKANQDITAKTLNIAAKMGSGRFPPLDGVEKDIAKKQSRIASATKASQKLHIKGYVEPARPKTPDNGDRGYGKGRYMGDSVELDGDALDEKEVWDKPNPKKTHHKLTSAQVSKARAKARAAGRPYPNLVDNMAVMKEETVEEAYKGAGSSALKLADRIRQERLKREASEKRAQEMLGNKSDEKKEVK